MATSDALATAKEQTGTHVGEVAGEARARARGLMEESRERLGGQADREAGRAASGMHRWAGELHALSEGRREEAGQALELVQQAADRLDEWAGRLDRDGFQGVMGDLQRFARRRPGAFLLGAGAAGFLVGRLVRNRPTGDGHENGHGEGPYGAYGYAGETAGSAGYGRSGYGDPAVAGGGAYTTETAGVTGGSGAGMGTSVFEPDVEDFDPDPPIEPTGAGTGGRRPAASSRPAPPATPPRPTRGGSY